MKLVIPRLGRLAATVQLGLGFLPLAQTQGYIPIYCWPRAEYSCSAATNWVETVDLDGDANAEFLHWSFQTEQRCAQWSEGQLFGEMYYDYTEAFFPTERVQLYVELQPWRAFYTAVLTNAQAIVPEPKSAGANDLFWEWNAPEAMAWLGIVGLGIGERELQIVAPPPEGRIEFSFYGYLDNSPNYVFGFRVSKADGWHLGWLRLARVYEPHSPLPYKVVELAEYDVHPEPNTEIRAGEYAQPRLQVRLAGEQVIVSWPADHRVCTLERTTRLDPPNWQPGPPTTTNSVVFDASDAPWYFRLKR